MYSIWSNYVTVVCQNFNSFIPGLILFLTFVKSLLTAIGKGVCLTTFDMIDQWSFLQTEISGEVPGALLD